MNSMTGHGRGERVSHGMRAVVECFSVNRKQAEVSVAAPRDLAWIEPPVRAETLKRVARGKVQVNVAIERAQGSHPKTIDAAAAARFLKDARALQKSLKLEGSVTIQDVLAAPGVVTVAETPGQDAWPVVRGALQAALDAMLVMRAREGANLRREFTRGISRMESLVRRAAARAPQIPRRARENLLRRLEAAQLPAGLLDARVATEIAIFAERCDVTEELARLRSHIAQFRENLSANGPVGRTLEFLCQEMGREWNTIGAKANDAPLAQLVVQARAALDRLREQLANIE